MAYIGREPTIGNFQVCDAISVVNNQAAYTMQVGGVNVVPETANHMLVSLNGILQAPGSSYTVSGSTITFASNLVTGDVIDFIQILGSVLDLGVPSDNTVTTAKLASTSVTAAKLNNDIISGTTALTSEPADTDEFLVSDAGTLKRIDYSLIKGGGITEADMWRTTASTAGATGVFSSNWERVDTYDFSHLGTGMSQASGIFTFPSTGIWRVAFQSNFTGLGVQYAGLIIAITTNNSTYNQHVKSYTQLDDSSDECMVHIEGIVDIRNITTHKVRFEQQQSASGGSWAGGDSNRTSATFIRLGDT